MDHGYFSWEGKSGFGTSSVVVNKLSCAQSREESIVNRATNDAELDAHVGKQSSIHHSWCIESDCISARFSCVTR